MTQISCPLCHEKQLVKTFQRVNLCMYSCGRCGLDFGEESTVSATSGDGAVETDPHHFSTLLEQSGPLRAALSGLIDRRLPLFEKRLGGKAKYWLEIGPGSGLLSSIIAEHGCVWRGCEINAAMAEEMLKRGIDVVHEDFSNIDPASLFTPDIAAQGGFDIVFLSQVLEHVRHPDKMLKNILMALRPGGIVYVDVPNHQGLTAVVRKLNRWGASYGEVVPPFHMIAYSAKTLQYALRQAGFDHIYTQTSSYNHAIFGLAHAHTHASKKMHGVWTLSGWLNLGGNLAAIAQRPVTEIVEEQNAD